MKIACTPLLLLLFITTASAQKKSRTQPFIIKGQFTDCQDKFLLLSFEDLNGQRYTDTIHIDKDGNFYLKTWKVKAPVQADLEFTKTRIYDMNVAPGFDLTLTASLSDALTLQKTKKISGKGAECNEYRFIADSIFSTSVEKMRNANMQSMSDTVMLANFNEENRLYDSVATAVFSKRPFGDRNFDFCRQVTDYEVVFTKLSRLFFIIDWFNYDNEKATRFLKNNFDNRVLNDIFKNEYMLSGYYKTFMSTQYLNRLVDLDYEKDPSLRDNELYVLGKINKEYKGLLKEYALYHRLQNMIRACQSLKEFDATRKQLRPFIAGLINGDYKRALYNYLDEQEIVLDKIKPGMPAPAFTLQSITGATHSLADYKGKVVYLDVWASWCSPCRQETPKLKALYEKYKNDDRIAFLSIAVSDHIDKWKKAVEDDKATWTQLFDKGNTIQEAYRASAIPKFILIDKQGNIVNPDAPRPSSGREIEKLLQAEILK
jgi:thiol-disulfide isomerase/thioredoxin